MTLFETLRIFLRHIIIISCLDLAMNVLLLVVLCLMSIVALSTDTTKITVALNCGSDSQTVSSSDNSFKYQPDGSSVTGPSVDVDYHSDATVSASELKYSHQKQLYMFERHTYSEMTYSLPVRQGKHTLVLKFAEMYFSEAGKRVFDVKIGDKLVVQDLDIVKKTGGRFAAHQEYIEFEVKNDGIYIDGQRVPKGLQSKKLKVTFAKGKADNPIIQGIVVYNTPIQNSPRDEYLKMKKEWSSQHQMRKARKEQEKLRQMIKIQKKKEKNSIRNDQLVFEDNEANNPETGAPQKFGRVRQILMSPVGILIWAVIYVYALGFLYSRIFKLRSPKQLKIKPE